MLFNTFGSTLQIWRPPAPLLAKLLIIVLFVNSLSCAWSRPPRMGEWVQRDRDPSSEWYPFPGNVRPWILGANGSDHGSYSFKVMKYPINAKLDRKKDNIPFNHLQFGSYHPGGANFMRADGSCSFLGDDTNVQVLQELATCNGRERTNEED